MKNKIKENIEIKEDCWIWKGAKNPKGYGKIRDGKKIKLAHRASYEAFIGKIEDGFCICHKCDITDCVNPNHLWKGTHEDNAKDRKKKGRSSDIKGENHGGSKLKEFEILNVLKLLKDGITQRKIAEMYGVHQATIFRISKNKNWKHVIKQN